MCNCKQELQEDKDGLVAKHVAKRYRATIREAGLVEYAFPLVRRADGSTKLMCVTTSTLRVETNERKKPVDVPLLHAYCPFCGIKYGEVADDPEEVMA